MLLSVAALSINASALGTRSLPCKYWYFVLRWADASFAPYQEPFRLNWQPEFSRVVNKWAISCLVRIDEEGSAAWQRVESSHIEVRARCFIFLNAASFHLVNISDKILASLSSIAGVNPPNKPINDILYE